MPTHQQNLKAFFSGKRSPQERTVPGRTEEDVQEHGLQSGHQVEEVRGSHGDPTVEFDDLAQIGSSSRALLVPLRTENVYSIFDKNASRQPLIVEKKRGRKRKADEQALKPPIHPKKAGSSKARSSTDVNEDKPAAKAGQGIVEKDFARQALSLLQVPEASGSSSRTISRASSRSSMKGSAFSEPIVIDDDGEAPGSQNDPISIDESPTVDKGPPPAPHPFFAPRQARPASSTSAANGAATYLKTAYPAPWPDGESQHVRGQLVDSLQTALRSESDMPFKRRKLNNPHQTALAPLDYKTLVPNLFAPSPPSPNHVQPSSPTPVLVPQSAHLRHPALARLVQPVTSEHSELWCEKYRPLRAAEVLGNESQALYLKDWLQALELDGSAANQFSAAPNGVRSGVNGEQRKTVIRAVDKSRRRKRRRRDDDWIVPSDDDGYGSGLADDPIEDWNSADGDAVSDNGSTASSAGPPPFLATPRPSRHPPIHDFLQRLTNAILLFGPPGCGKTAAVYACAHELGWDVFEVYPGIGKRSGQGLMALVGEVGRNHLVRKGPVANKVAFEKLLLAGDKSAGHSLQSGTRGQPISIDSSSPPDSGFGFIESCPSTGTNGSAPQSRLTPTPEGGTVRQSVILLEEVDVLFREDAGFWQAVVALLKDSHRPVIMTCNDPSLVPVQDLPLQEHLCFQPPPADLLISYMDRIAWVEGHELPTQVLHGIREANNDLRRAINALQWFCSGGKDFDSRREAQPSSVPLGKVRVEEMEDGSLKIPKPLISFLDYRSFVDAHLRRPDHRIIQALEPDRAECLTDDEQGHVTMAKPPPADTDVGIAAYLHDEEFANEVDATAISYFSHISPLLENEPAADNAGITRLLTYLAPLIPISSYLLPHPAVIVDYAPFVRKMVHADDKGEEADEAREAARFSRAGRPMRLAATKLNTRLPYARWISLDDLALEEARRDSLCMTG